MSALLSSVSSIKVKLGILVGASVVVAAVLGVVATDSGLSALLVVPVSRLWTPKNCPGCRPPSPKLVTTSSVLRSTTLMCSFTPLAM